MSENFIKYYGKDGEINRIEVEASPLPIQELSTVNTTLELTDKINEIIQVINGNYILDFQGGRNV